MACSQPDRDAEKAIRLYDDALIKAYFSRDSASLRPVAGEKEVRKVGTLIEYKRIGGLVLESELLSLKMDSCTKTSNDAMTATTTERWRYYDRPVQPGVPPGKVVESEMKLKYFLKKDGGTWKVEKLEGISTKPLNDAK